MLDDAKIHYRDAVPQDFPAIMSVAATCAPWLDRIKYIEPSRTCFVFPRST
jgi:hypothetical protein